MSVIDRKRNTAVRLKDVAEAAKVSVATVSMALRNHPAISKETRDHVLDIQKQMGYQPLRASSSGRSDQPQAGRQLCFMYCLVDFPFDVVVYAPFFEGILQACHAQDVRIEMASMDGDGAFRNNRSKSIPSWVDGVIVAGKVSQPIVDNFLQRKLKVVVLGNHDVDGVHSVGVEIFRYGEMAARRAISEGHKNMAYLQQNPANYFEREYLLGITGALASAGQPLPSSRIFRLENSLDSVIHAVDRIYKTTPRITAVLANAGGVASAAAAELRRHSQSGGRKPTVYCLAASEQGASQIDPECHILNMQLERCGQLAVHRLRQIVETREFVTPYTSLLPPCDWLR